MVTIHPQIGEEADMTQLANEGDYVILIVEGRRERAVLQKTGRRTPLPPPKGGVSFCQIFLGEPPSLSLFVSSFGHSISPTGDGRVGSFKPSFQPFLNCTTNMQHICHHYRRCRH
jgi:hypothetical protein